MGVVHEIIFGFIRPLNFNNYTMCSERAFLISDFGDARGG